MSTSKSPLINLSHCTSTLSATASSSALGLITGGGALSGAAGTSGVCYDPHTSVSASTITQRVTSLYFPQRSVWLALQPYLALTHIHTGVACLSSNSVQYCCIQYFDRTRSSQIFDHTFTHIECIHAAYRVHSSTGFKLAIGGVTNSSVDN